MLLEISDPEPIGIIGTLKNWRCGMTARTRRTEDTLQGVNTLPNPEPDGAIRYPVSYAIKLPFGRLELYPGYETLDKVHPVLFGSPGIGEDNACCSSENVGTKGLFEYTGGLLDI